MLHLATKINSQKKKKKKKKQPKTHFSQEVKFCDLFLNMDKIQLDCLRSFLYFLHFLDTELLLNLNRKLYGQCTDPTMRQTVLETSECDMSVVRIIKNEQVNWWQN